MKQWRSADGRTMSEKWGSGLQWTPIWTMTATMGGKADARARLIETAIVSCVCESGAEIAWSALRSSTSRFEWRDGLCGNRESGVGPNRLEWMIVDKPRRCDP